MVLSDVSIKRPVFATVLSLLLVVLGIASFLKLPVREYPKIDTPIVSITTVYTGASNEVIESRTGVKISEIFAQHGEAVFRKFESDLVAEMPAWSGKVISTGGGLVVNPDNLTSLKSHALVVCLWATPETIYQRTKHQSHRPLLQGPDPLGNIRALLAAREAAYKQADVLVNTEQRSLKEIAAHVLHHFRAAQQSPPRL